MYPGLNSSSNILNLIELLTSWNPDLTINTWAVTGAAAPTSILEFQNVSTNFPKDQKLLDTALNPKMLEAFQNMTAANISEYKSLFDKLQKNASVVGLLPVLWYSRLPCFDVRGVTSERDGEKSILKYCQWRGEQVPCSAIFKTTPTDEAQTHTGSKSKGSGP